MTYQISNTNTFENVHLKYQNAHLHVYALFHTFGACNILCAGTVAHQIIDVFTNACSKFLLIIYKIEKLNKQKAQRNMQISTMSRIFMQYLSILAYCINKMFCSKKFMSHCIKGVESGERS